MPTFKHRGASIYYSVDRAFVANCQTPSLVLAGNDEAHPYPISEETAKLLPHADFIAIHAGFP